MSEPAGGAVNEPGGAARPDPVRLEGAPAGSLSRALWLVKWLLLLPHLVVLCWLWAAFALLTVFAGAAILVTGRYPRGLFDFNLGVLRWTWRVGFYGYSALGTDRYPPFTLSDVPDYPARLDVAYPEHLSRGLVLVKTWLLAIPHYLVLAVFLGGGVGPRLGLISLLAVFGGVVLLLRGSYPSGVYGLTIGMDRWVARVTAYVALMTDSYPPLRLDQGGPDPSGPLPPGPMGTSTAARASAGAVGGLMLLAGSGMVVAGARLPVGAIPLAGLEALMIGGLAVAILGIPTVLLAARPDGHPADDDPGTDETDLFVGPRSTGC